MIAGKAIPILAVLMCSALSACNKGISEEVKSLTYYKEHVEEANTVFGQCQDLQNNELSRMAPAQRLHWEGTPQGINCKNASDARSTNNYKQYQERMREEAKKYR
jgi:predicted small secreted protein